MLPLSLYVHYPWCRRKCPYCDFNSYPKAGDPDADYLKALLADFDGFRPLIGRRSLVSIYFGGGTPSLFPPALAGRLLRHVSGFITRDTEISLEANPGTVSLGSLRAYRAEGFNRLSLGVQSFDERSLRLLGRAHSAHDAREAVDNALRAGFDNLNLDIMHGLPEQTVRQALSDLKTAAGTGCGHLSWYELTLEEDTRFGRHPPALPPEEVLGEIESAGFAFLRGQGFRRYEVSAFCRDRPCAHNLNYWLFNDYLGIGAGAHTKLRLGERTFRRACADDPAAYLLGGRGRLRPVPPGELPFEFMLNRLRLARPLKKAEFVIATGLDFACAEGPLKRAESLGLLKLDGTGCELTGRGRLMLNDILELFLI